jgi:hypothetical protein
VRLPPERRLDVLAICGSRTPMHTLLLQLEKAGFGVDVATDLTEARRAFFGSGGHHCVVVGPDVPPGLAGMVVKSLRKVDPELPAATFGPRLENVPVRTAMLAAFHPGSRAGLGALLRFLRELPERG